MENYLQEGVNTAYDWMIALFSSIDTLVEYLKSQDLSIRDQYIMRNYAHIVMLSMISILTLIFYGITLKVGFKIQDSAFSSNNSIILGIVSSFMFIISIPSLYIPLYMRIIDCFSPDLMIQNL